ncbi:DUF6916 family protein [Undibacterium crateris]|uniref:DUF6916 family protein n=1 Tax=Undibacterium crateris TaxID=2528175 RepID=UPI001389A24B|nr:hypothetical protein [Undibacterium crateris]NDI85206.1 hypothetical protein [Undibacterium crateris]
MTLSTELFHPHIGSYFDIYFDNQQQLRLLLQSVDDHGRSGQGYHSFSLMFFCDGEYQLVQNTYPLQHPVLGELNIFLVPVARKDQGICYQASFTLKVVNP